MSDLRNLLLDCRSALRRSNRKFEDDPLREKIDEALNELGKDDDEDELAEPETRTAQQVAYAWQIATRSVKLTHPDLYEKLSRRVRDMLDADVLQDPANEFIKLEARMESAAAAEQAAVKELADLRQALADAVPLTGRDAIGSDAECAQRRVQMLVKSASQGIGLPKPVSDDPHDMMHTREELQAVAQGRRALSRWERSWCLAEALVMSDMNATQLKKLKDIDLVKMVLAGTASSAPMQPTSASKAK
ncbi:MAG TPA: hypothetical protein VK753_11180 [Xanthomonadaceae bacterium]|nr:hypothetical protein [Xanthomonadaceae bacterium]